MPIGAANRLIQLEKEYYAGVHIFTTVGNGDDDIPLEQLVTTSNIEVFSIRGSNVGIGTTNPLVTFDIRSTDAIRIPKGTDAQRPVGKSGMVRFNTTTQQFEGYGNGEWTFLGTIKNQAGDTFILPEYLDNSDDKGLHFFTSNEERFIINRDGNVGIGTTLPRQKLDVQGNIYVDGNLGIGTTIPLKPLHIEQGAIFLNGNVGFGLSNPQYTVEVSGLLKADTLITTNVSISNLTISGSVFAAGDSSTFRNNIQLKPLQTTIVVPVDGTTTFNVDYPGQYKVYPENTEVYRNGYKMAYLSDTIKDYDVSYSNDYNNFKTQFTLIMADELHFNDILDVVFWPTYLDPEGLLQPGYTLQNITYTYWQLGYNSSNIYYDQGNIGIGTSDPQYLLHVERDGYIRELFSSNITVQENIIIGSNLGIQTTNPIVSLDIRTTDAILLPKGTTDQRPPTSETGFIRYNTSRRTFEGYSTSGWVTIGSFRSEDDGVQITPEYIPGSNDQAIRFYTNSNLQMILNPHGNLGIGTQSPLEKLHVQGSMYASGNITSAGTLQTSGQIQAGSVSVSGTLVTDSTILTSNMFIYGKLDFGDASSNLKSRLQVHPVRQVFYIEEETKQTFTIITPGMYGASASNVDIFLGQFLLSYYSSNIKDYEVSYANSYANFNTTYTITLTRPAQYGDVVDITLWPQIIQDSGPVEGYAYQQVRITDTYFIPYGTDVAFLGNVGIGTTQTNEKLVVAGNIVPNENIVHNLGSSNLRWKDLYLSGNSIYIGDSIIRRNSNIGNIEFINSNNTPLDLSVGGLYATYVGIGTSYASDSLQITNGNAIVSGNIGIGTDNPIATMHIEGNLLTYGSIISSNIGSVNKPALTLIQTNENQSIIQCYNIEQTTSNEVMTLTNKGNLYLTGNNILIGYNNAPVFTPSGFIGQENVYTWYGDDTIVDVANESGAANIKEPFWKVFSGFTSTYFNRIQAQGAAQLLTTYYLSQYDRQYTIYMSSLTQDAITSDASPEITVTTPTNFVSMRLPIKPGFSHSLFLKLRCNNVFSVASLFITNTSFTSFYRLNAQSTSTRDAFLNTSWIGPNGEMSASHQYHEWVMFSIPKYIIDEYSYDETYDNKSRYRKNIIICAMAGVGTETANILYCSGIAMRTNPYHLCFQNARNIFSRVNGGNPLIADRAFTNTDNYEGRLTYNTNVVFNNVRIPICPPLNPNGNSLPDFYLVYIGSESSPNGGIGMYVYLQSTTDVNDVLLLGRFSKCIKGRYGNFLSENLRIALGIIIPSPDLKYIIYIGGRPYLNLRLDNLQFGLGGVSYSRGFFTEVIDERGPITSLTRYTNVPIQWLTITTEPVSNYLPVTANLTMLLDPELYDVNNALWRDFSGNYYDFTINPNAFRTINNIKHMDFDGSYGIAKRVINNALVDVPSFPNATMIVFSTIRTTPSNYRSLIRGLSFDHQAMTISSDLIGFYDNNVANQINTTLNVTSIPNFDTKFNMLTFKLSRTSPQWQMQYNLNNIVYSIINGNATFDQGFCCIGAYHNTSTNVNDFTGPWGKIGLFLYYNRHLSTQETLQIYNYYRARFNLAEDTYLGSYNFRISHPDGRTLKYDAGANIIRLNSGVDFTLDILKSPEANFNYSRNRIGFKRSGTNEHMYHSATGIASICRMTANYGTGGEWSWGFVQTSNTDVYQIRNDHANNEYYLGYDTSVDQVMTVDAKDIRRVAGWTITPTIDITHIIPLPLTYPLDSLTSNARITLNAAFSVKRLSEFYLGPVVKIRRSTDSVTQDFFADYYGRLGTSSNGGGTFINSWLGAASGFVTTWFDQSGNGRHATQTTNSLQPTIRPNGILVDFLATTYMTIPSGTVPVGTDSPYTYVVRHGNLRNYGGFIGAGTWATNFAANTFRYDGVAGLYRAWWWNRDYTFGIAAGGNSASIVYNRTTLSGFVNGVGFTTQASGGGYSVAAGTQYIGQSHGNEPMDGELYNVFIFNNALSASDRSICEEII